MDDLANLINDTQVSEFNDTPPPAQRRMISLDAHHMHAQHVALWNYGNREDFANIHSFSLQLAQSNVVPQEPYVTSPLQPSAHHFGWMQGVRA